MFPIKTATHKNCHRSSSSNGGFHSHAGTPKWMITRGTLIYHYNRHKDSYIIIVHHISIYVPYQNCHKDCHKLSSSHSFSTTLGIPLAPDCTRRILPPWEGTKPWSKSPQRRKRRWSVGSRSNVRKEKTSLYTPCSTGDHVYMICYVYTHIYIYTYICVYL